MYLMSNVSDTELANTFFYVNDIHVLISMCFQGFINGYKTNRPIVSFCIGSLYNFLVKTW